MLTKDLPKHYCPSCKGFRRVPAELDSDGLPTDMRECPECNGTGRLPQQKRIRVKARYASRPSSSGEIDAPFIQSALKRKYGKAPWVYFPELRNAPTWSATRTIDGYAVHTGDAGSFVAFEIKITPADMKRDLDSQKWDDWTGLCTEFYFVTPPGMVDAGEIPDPAGLLEVDLYGNVRTVHRARSLPMFTVPTFTGPSVVQTGRG